MKARADTEGQRWAVAIEQVAREGPGDEKEEILGRGDPDNRGRRIVAEGDTLIILLEDAYGTASSLFSRAVIQQKCRATYLIHPKVEK